MKLRHIDDIVIGKERQRSNMADKEVVSHVTDLATELSEKGLLHPIVIRTHEDPTLVAGECRLTAVTILKELGLGIKFDGEVLEPGYIPCSVMGELSDVEYEEAELTENLRRLDLLWQDKTAAIARLHALRTGQLGAYGVGARPREGQSHKDTAREINKTENVSAHQVEVVKDAVELLDHLDDPDVMKAKSQKEAVKIVQRKHKEKARIAMAEEYVPTASPHTLHHDDCCNVLREVEDGTIDIILTDPPYGIDMHKGTSWDGDTHGYDDSAERLGELFAVLPREWYRVAAEKSHAYVFCDISNWSLLRVKMEAAGWVVWQRPLIWYKGNIGSFANSERGFRYTYECILFANKGLRETNGLPHDVICINQIQNQDHPAGKPPELYSHLLSISALPGDTVLDCFAGGGPIFPAATKNHCVAIGCELDKKYHAIAKLRMEEEL